MPVTVCAEPPKGESPQTVPDPLFPREPVCDFRSRNTDFAPFRLGLLMSATENLEAQAIRNQYEELAELAGSLAHEIKNPLSVIHMNIDLLSEDLADIDSPIRRRSLDKVEIVRQQCERMEALLRDFPALRHG
jgi:signal transduction histidine kinase